MSTPPSPGACASRPSSDTGAASDAQVGPWLAVQAALVPIIGQAGFVALYQRCLHLALPQHPWLSQAENVASGDFSFEPLQRALSQQPPHDAAAVQALLLRSFLDILTNLIGPSLVQRLLGTAVVAPFEPPPEQDSPP